MFKLIVSDLDGTLVNDSKVVMPETRKELNELHQKGVLIGIASGRPIDTYMMQLYQRCQLDFQFDFMIGMNGGQLFDFKTKKMESFDLLSSAEIKEIIEGLSHFHLNPFVYCEEGMMCMHSDALMEEAIVRNQSKLVIADDVSQLYEKPNYKVLYRFSSSKHLQEVRLYAQKKFHTNYHGFQTNPTMLEFQSKNISKGKALRRYCESKGIDLKDCIAFGDTTNDNEMLKFAGLGVCMKNGTEDTKACADDISLYSNNEDGIGKYLSHILKKDRC